MIKVAFDQGLDDFSIEFVQAFEKDLDKAMVEYGFTRSTTTKAGGFLEFDYRQFGRCLKGGSE